jgi:uncharacterized protein with PQ loop repeat
MTALIGWLSSLVLLVTILIQVRRQWHARHTEGVSPWLFVGQLAANVGFVVYSWLLGSVVFVVTNVALALTSIVGLVVLRSSRKDQRRREGLA